MAAPGLTTLSPIERLKKAMRQGLLYKEVTLNNGDVFGFCFKPMTLAEEERIRKDVGDNAGPNAYALRLVIERALNQDGTRMFNIGHLAELRNLVEKQDAEAIMLALLTSDGEPVDMKSPAA